MKVDRHPLLSALAIFLQKQKRDNSRRNDFYFFLPTQAPPPLPFFLRQVAVRRKMG